ncbi:ribokinase [Brachybacterium vulturis]|uniref:Ribokinase n=1 Tax=Brachybacterium vulturis TaxID=2017484 RepID=A0A291GJQ0_9MICO|nr:ribokinase [Brachybacterium vulturis]ATG50425.1 ribokinase [Brachybacterium vulturis]
MGAADRTSRQAESSTEILVVGSVNLDLVLTLDALPLPGETLYSRSSRRSPGGKGANQALAAARLGGRVRLAARVGQDSEADQALALLREDGVDLSAVEALAEHATGLAIVEVDAQGENSIVLVPGANLVWNDLGQTVALVADADIFVCQGEIPAEVVDAVSSACSPAQRLLLNLAPVIPVRSETLRCADPLVVNEHEGRAVLALLGGDAVEEADVMRDLLDAGVRSVVMTLGPRGALLGDADGLRQVPSPQVEAVDTTGAGDAFVGGLALRLAAGDDLDQAARFAARLGAAAVTRDGAQPSYPRTVDGLPSPTGIAG